MTIKILYAEKRRPELSREAFSRGWRIHAGDAMKCGDFWDPILFYVQNDAPARPPGIAGVDASYDCVGEVCYATRADCDASIAAPSLPGITQDGDHIFSRVDQISMIAEHRTIVDRRAGDIKLFVFARFGDAADQIAARTATLAAGDGEFARFIRQAGIAHALTETPLCDGAIEFAYDTIEEARLGHADWLATIAPQPLQPITIAAHSYILYDKRNCE